MMMPSYPDLFEVLCLQAADEGRGDVLFGESLTQARAAIRPFVVGEKFPSIYLEFPLVGSPFMDVTLLYNKLAPGTRIDSAAAAQTESVIDWFATNCSEDEQVSFGFELDTKNPSLPRAAIHFQPRQQLELVRPFCEAIGEPRRADLYLNLAERMPTGWPLSFFGMFRGRPDAPLRACGYLGHEEQVACAKDPSLIAKSFDHIGFEAYDSTMLAQISELMGLAEKGLDFQFDVYDDGHLSPVFALDLQFGIKQPELVRESFEKGVASRLLHRLQDWGIADERWHLAGNAAFARGISVELEDGSTGRLALTLMPQWVKVRWRNRALQPSKLYHLATTSLL